MKCAAAAVVMKKAEQVISSDVRSRDMEVRACVWRACVTSPHAAVTVRAEESRGSVLVLVNESNERA